MINLEKLEADVAACMKATKCDWKAAVRRVLGTADFNGSIERVEAALAKRERRRKRAGGSSS